MRQSRSADTLRQAHRFRGLFRWFLPEAAYQWKEEGREEEIRIEITRNYSENDFVALKRLKALTTQG